MLGKTISHYGILDKVGGAGGIGIAVILALAPLYSWDARAQSVSMVVQGTAGLTKVFLDEPAQITGGGSLRLYLTRRFSVGPEFLYSRGSDFEQLWFVPNVAFDLSGSRKRVTPYLIGGIGYLRCRDKRIDFTTNEVTGSAGIGVRILLSSRVFLSPELRLGSHEFPRAVVSVGYSF